MRGMGTIKAGEFPDLMKLPMPLVCQIHTIPDLHRQNGEGSLDWYAILVFEKRSRLCN